MRVDEGPVLKFSPTAWAKLLYFRDRSDNEVGGFAITESDDLLSVIDFVTVKQQVTCVSVKFDDEAVANFFEDQVDLGRRPEQFARIWCHTHPGFSPEPSMIDEETFDRVFGNCEWAVMFILAEDNRTYARLSFNVGPAGQILIPVEIDYSCQFAASDWTSWETEYRANVTVDKTPHDFGKNSEIEAAGSSGDLTLPYDFVDELEQMSPDQRHLILDELAERPELWNDESEVTFI